MRVTIVQKARNVSEADRIIAEWIVSDSVLEFGWVGSFTQLATPDTMKVNTYQLYIEDDDMQ